MRNLFKLFFFVIITFGPLLVLADPSGVIKNIYEIKHAIGVEAGFQDASNDPSRDPNLVDDGLSQTQASEDPHGVGGELDTGSYKTYTTGTTSRAGSR